MAIDTTGLEPLGPVRTETRVAIHLRQLIFAATARTPDAGLLEAAVREAREAGESWDVISMALGISPEEARGRFG